MKHSIYHRVLAGTIIEKPRKAIVQESFFVKKKYCTIWMTHNKNRKHGAFNKKYGYCITSSLSLDYEVAPTLQVAICSYLETLVDSILWLRKDEERLSGHLLRELRSMERYIRLVEEQEDVLQYYNIVPARTHEDFQKSYQAVLDRYPHKDYVDIDITIMEEDTPTRAEIDAKIHEIYKQIEPYYSDANRRLAESND